MKAIDFLQSYPYLPLSVMKRPFERPSNAELRRWLKDGAIVINNKKVKANDEIKYPITELILFPEGKRKTTIIKQ